MQQNFTAKSVIGFPYENSFVAQGLEALEASEALEALEALEA